MHIAQWIRTYQTALTPQFGQVEAQALAYTSMQFVLSVNKVWILTNSNTLVSKSNEQQLESILDDLLAYRPLQYITQTTHFCGVEIGCSPAALIPRPETEELVYWALDFARQHVQTTTPIFILDACTGTGCIALALKHLLVDAAQIDAFDISTEALALASLNSRNLGLPVHFWQSDLLVWASESSKSSTLYDLIVSNPPYIPVSEQKKMQPNVLLYEPHLALFVPDENPLLFYEALANLAMQHLRVGGMLFLECNEYLAQDVYGLIQQKKFEFCEIKRDINGKRRMIRCQKTQ